MEHPDPKSKRIEKTRNQSFLSLSMGMIQPEWLYMSHFFNEPPQENNPNHSSVERFPPTNPKPNIRIYFRSRK